MAYYGLSAFLSILEKHGELLRVSAPVSAFHEIAEITSRVSAANGPALLFERVDDTPFPVATNVLGSAKRILLALGDEPAAIGNRLVHALEAIQPPRPSALWEQRSFLRRAMRARVRIVQKGAVHEAEEPDLSRIPVLTSWPLDGGPFVTWPMVLTKHPETGGRNLGTYRMHVHDPLTTGMHMQIQKGGGFHYGIAEARGESLPACVILGGDPVLMMASIAPLPENVDELAFAAFLRGAPMPLVRAKTVPIEVPAMAEFILEGRVLPEERRTEGPFGDHFGHYSHAAPFPVFRVSRITRRKNAIYPASVVGQPPQEDRAIGDALQEMMAPMACMMHPEVRDLWAFYEAGFHNLLAISVRERYEKEAMKAAFGLLGTGQVSLSKVVVTVGPDVNCRRAEDVFRAIGQNFHPEEDFTLLSRTALDTLDFTSYQMNLGSKMILDATPKRKHPPRPLVAAHRLPDVRTIHGAVVGQFLFADSCLVVQVQNGTPGRPVLEQLLSREVQEAYPSLAELPMLAVVSDDVRMHDPTHLVWGILTRFDAARDVLFPHVALVGACPVYRGTLGIDATWKDGYPDPVQCSEEIGARVTRRWLEYGFGSAAIP